MRKLEAPRHVPALFALAALLLLADLATSQDASLLSSSREYVGGRASQQRLPGASGSGSAALFEANTHLLLHGEVLLGAALFVPPRATQQQTANSATITEAGAIQSAAEGGLSVSGGEAAPLPPTPKPAEASSAQLAASLAPQPADQAVEPRDRGDGVWEQALSVLAASAVVTTAGGVGGNGSSGSGSQLVATVRRGGQVVAQARAAISPAAMAAAMRSAAAEAAAGASQPLTARLPYTFLLPLAERITAGHQQHHLQQQGQGLGQEAGGLQVLLVLELPALPGTAGRTAAFVASSDTAGGLEVRLTLDAAAPHLAAVLGPPPPPPPPDPQPQQPAAARQQLQTAAAVAAGQSAVAEPHTAAPGHTWLPPGLVAPHWHAATSPGGPRSPVDAGEGGRDGGMAALRHLTPQHQQTHTAAAAAAAQAQCVAAACHHWAARLHAGEHLDGQQSAAGGGGYAATARRGPRHSCLPLHLAAITGSSSSSGSSGRPDTSALDPQSQCPALIIMSPQDVVGGRGAAVSSGGSGSSGSSGKERLLSPRQGHRQGQRSGAGAARDGEPAAHVLRAGDEHSSEDSLSSGEALTAAAAGASATAAGVPMPVGDWCWRSLVCGAVSGALAAAAVAAAVAAASGRGRSNAHAAVETQHLLGPGADVPAGGEERHGVGAFHGYGDEALGTHHPQHLEAPAHSSGGGTHGGADGSGSPGREGGTGGLLQRTASGLGNLLSTPLRRARRLGAPGRYAPAGSPIAEEGRGGNEYGSGGGAGGATAVAAAGGMLEGSGEARGGEGGDGGGGGGGTDSLLRWRHHMGGAAGGGEAGAMAASEESEGAAFLAELAAAGSGSGGGGGGSFASTLAQLSPSVLKLLAAGRSATGSWGRDEQGRLRRFSARTTRILNSILASSGTAGTVGAAGAAANGHDGGSADTE